MSGSPSGSPTLVSLNCTSAQYWLPCGSICNHFLSDAQQQSFRGPRQTTRTAWPWRCSSFSSSTITPPVSTSPSSKGKQLAFLETLFISWESTVTKRYGLSISLSRRTYSLLLLDSCFVSCCPAVWSWWLSDRVDDSTLYHHGWKSHMEQHPGGLATVRSHNQRPIFIEKYKKR